MQTNALEIRALTNDELAEVAGGAINLERIIIAAATKAFGMLWDKYGDQITDAAGDIAGSIGAPDVVPGNLL
jgi:hypothetical protein